VGERLPESITGPGALVLRRWVQEDVQVLGEAVRESVEHLRPWMPWIVQEPLSVTERRALIEEWEHDWLAGGDAVMGVFVDGLVAGGSGCITASAPVGLRSATGRTHRFCVRVSLHQPPGY
jgi:ribosomal-protein-serine acetyltransferase